jgi:plastocyanin
MKYPLILTVLAALALLLGACAPAALPAEAETPTEAAAPIQTPTPDAGYDDFYDDDPVATPAVEVDDQPIVDGTVTIARVAMQQAGWVVIHIEAGGSPGEVIGHAAVPAGESLDVVVEIDAAKATPTLIAMLHVDEGVVGTYEFPGPDAPVRVDGEIVMQAFQVLAPAAAAPSVTITGSSFSPGSLTVKVGTTVTWTNTSIFDHTVTSDSALFDSGGLGQGGVFTFTFNQAGTFTYHCSYHPGMIGTIVVTP